jgi:thiamine-monophosphate kinase
MRGEFAAVSAIHALLPRPGESVGIWIGDDAAAVALAGSAGADWLLLAADTVVAGVHADLALTGLDDLGWKAMAASISDIAAMGGEVGHALVTVAGPPGTDLEVLYQGIAAASLEFGCPVVGGDLTNARDVVVTVAVTGFCTGSPVRRDGARPGDGVWVTGPLGASAAGLRLLRDGSVSALPTLTSTGVGSASDAIHGARLDAVRAHARPVPRLSAGRSARAAGATAMIDVSDGLTADLDHIARSSGVGLRLESVPVHRAATVEEALTGGEDFELAFCAPDAAAVEAAFSGRAAPVRIGTCTASPGERTLDGRPFVPSGWEHGWDEPVDPGPSGRANVPGAGAGEERA